MSRSGQVVAHKINGTVLFFDMKRGVGKITRSDTGEEIWAHHTDIAVKNPLHELASLVKGEAVLMDVVEGTQGRMKAVNIMGPDGGPVKGNEQAANGGGYESGPQPVPPRMQYFEDDDDPNVTFGPPPGGLNAAAAMHEQAQDALVANLIAQHYADAGEPM